MTGIASFQPSSHVEVIPVNTSTPSLCEQEQSLKDAATRVHLHEKNCTEHMCWRSLINSIKTLEWLICCFQAVLIATAFCGCSVIKRTEGRIVFRIQRLFLEEVGKVLIAPQWGWGVGPEEEPRTPTELCSPASEACTPVRTSSEVLTRTLLLWHRSCSTQSHWTLSSKSHAFQHT